VLPIAIGTSLSSVVKQTTTKNEKRKTPNSPNLFFLYIHGTIKVPN
jgi:hypothetical protein